jgi:ribosomal protein S18 acetylase RimI-like enzyme
VAPGAREWYYRLTPEGDFKAGAHIRWMDVGGKAAEESDVLEVEPPNRLVLRTQFVFAPTFAAAAAHVIKWELARDGDGASVRMSWEAGGPAARLLESEGDAQLQGLSLAADPAARAAIERRPRIGSIEVREVTPELVPEYLDFFDHHAFRDYPIWQSCYCMETHRTQGDDEWAERTAGDNRRDMSDSIKLGHVTGLLAFEAGKPVGWCNFGETTRLSGLMHRFGLTAEDHEGVGSVACFVIAAPYRGHGVASKLLDAAVERLRARGLRAVEAYPARSDDSAHSNYRGPLAMFLRAGFEPYGEIERHLIVRKTLA